MIKLKIISIFIILTGCNNPAKEKSIEVSKHIDEVIISDQEDTSMSDLNSNEAVNADSQSNNIHTKKTTKKNKLPEILLPVRYIEFPGDNNFNGKPMTQQIEIPKKIFENTPDSLSNLAIARYKTYDNFFPKAIADNFEEGTSREIVIYPKKLVFMFQLFENETATAPYFTKEITVKRRDNGELFTE